MCAWRWPIRAHAFLPPVVLRTAATSARRAHAETLTSAARASRSMARRSLASRSTSSRARRRNSGGRPIRAVMGRPRLSSGTKSIGSGIKSTAVASLLIIPENRVYELVPLVVAGERPGSPQPVEWSRGALESGCFDRSVQAREPSAYVAPHHGRRIAFESTGPVGCRVPLCGRIPGGTVGPGRDMTASCLMRKPASRIAAWALSSPASTRACKSGRSRERRCSA